MDPPSPSAAFDGAPPPFAGWKAVTSSAPITVAIAATMTWVTERAAIAVAHDSARSAALGSWPALWAAHAAGTTAVGTGLLLLWIVRRVSPLRFRGPAVVATACLMAVFPALLLGDALASGDWVSHQPFAPVVRWLVTAGLVLSTMFGAWALGRERSKALHPVTFAVASITALSADAFVLPGLYPAAHAFLYVVGTVCALLASWPVVLRNERITPLKLGATGVSALVLVTAWISPRFWSERDRSTVVLASPSVGAAISTVFRAPPRYFVRHELEHLDANASNAHVPVSSGKAIAPPPRSIVFIVVDTLRADALPPVRGDERPFAQAEDTPFLNRYLKGAFRFRQAYAQASQTKRSMPPMFRSLEPFESPAQGSSLPDVMKRAGLRPVAVVPQYFLIPAQKSSQELLVGFERVAVYEKDHQETLVTQATATLEQVAQQPFFAWIHFYNMHEPYFADRLLSGADGNAAQRYRRALRWLDLQISELVDSIERLGLSSSTAVVIASDHGEHLGEGRRTGHGDGVHEEEIHVPLAFRIPGTGGGIVDRLVGNIDIVPTLLGLLGRPPEPTHRGKSLLPLLREPRSPSSRTYYVQSGNGEIHGILTESGKLVYFEKQHTLYRYDRSPEPSDHGDRFGRDPASDRKLVSAMVRRNPELFRHELKSEDVIRLLVRRLREADPNRADDSLHFLLRLAALSDHRDVRRAAADLFERSSNAEVRRLAVRESFDTDRTGWSQRLKAWISRDAGTERELATVRGLAIDGQPAFSVDFAAHRLDELSRSPIGDLTRAWLDLVSAWQKPSSQFAAPLYRLLSTAMRAPETGADVVTLLNNVATLEGRPDTARTEIEALEVLILPSVDDDDPLVAIAACKALGQVGASRGREALRAVLENGDRDARVLQAALIALTKLEGRNAVPELLVHGKDPLFTVDVIHLLGDLGDQRALPFLERVARDHTNAWTRGQAQAALQRIRQKGPRAPAR